MKTLVKAIVLSISTALVAIPAMAAPQDHHQYSKSHAQQQHHAPQHHQQNKHPAQQHKQGHKKVDPSRDWRVGQKVPSQYQSKIYKVDHSKYKRLNKPGRNQQWIKVNGDYILMNVVNDKVIKIIAA
ncbi:RcnB family protein [Acinetobacter schindleri]|uniref:RcnB family protein n=1 Tax=Acinetobacter schindleri TaxID=108981 RepID=UPI00209BB48D|nr:RcnB family protein [Acinetobacter schindleri]MCO8068220.1 RcnB family protein [Acinetobacter schindleri]